MTSEDQLRAALLGGGQLTAILANSRRSMSKLLDQRESRWLTSLHAQQGDLHLLKSPDNAWMFGLMGASIFQRATVEAEKLHRAISHAYEVEDGALSRASQDAQWQSLRRNVFERLEGLFVFRERARVKSFLEKNFFLTPLLLQASDRIREFFGSAPVVLEVSTDPDDGNYQELWARIQTNSTPADALSTLTRFDEEWWLDASASSQDLLNIKLEYV